MSRKGVALVGLAAVMALASAGWAQNVVKKGDNLVEVTVAGLGSSKEEALRDAQRKAVEQGAGTLIYSQSKTQDMALVKDTVLARSAGFVQSYTIVGEKAADDGLVELKVKIVVSIKGIEDFWGVTVNLLKEMGRPKIMVFINEKIGNEVVPDSTVQTVIESELLKSGFILVDKNQLKEIDKKDLAAAVAEDNPAKVQAIAKRFGAQLFITGSCDAAAGERSAVQGVMLNRYGARGNIRVFNSDDAGLLASQNANEYSADRMPNVAADKALAALGDKIAPMIQDDILRCWLDAMTGGGAVKLEVDGITFKQATLLAEELKKIKDIKDVPDPEFHNKVAEYNFQATGTAKDLAKKIMVQIEKLDVTDVSQNVIKATYKE